MKSTTTRAWLAIGSFAVFIGSINTWIVQQRPAATLTVEMQSSVAARAKVFFDTGRDFSEAESEERWVPGDPTAHPLYFPFPPKTVRRIRFDPLDIAGVVELRSVIVERPGGHQIVRKFDLAKISALNQIASISLQDGIARIATDEGANDSQLLLPVETPVTAYYSTAQIFSWRVLRVDMFSLLAFLGLLAAAHYRRRWWWLVAAPLGAINKRLDAISQTLSRPGIWELDRLAILSYLLCLVAFVALSLAKLHGSSISLVGASYRGWTDVVHTPLLGRPKQVRSDEWGFHTPAILNQVLRPHPLAVTDSSVGPGKAALLGNVPCWHFTQLFRPQFWSFFFLPVDLAFAFYWQAKALLLLTGVFTLLLLITRSSAVAAVGALWYFFSAYTQWAYSWASLLPEMVGLFCWVISLTCYLLVGQNKTRLFIAAVLCAGAAINFALCAYPPQQIPLIAVGVMIVGWWLWSRHHSIWRRDLLVVRILAVGGCWVIVGAVMFWFYLDAKETLLAAAATVYPGQRSSSGGGVPIAQLISHFLDFWKSENSFPPSQGNICESAGYLWLAPVTLLIGRASAAPRQSSSLLIGLWAAFLLLLVWMLIPIPATIGHWIFFDRVPSFRCYHALGLINVAIVSIFLSQSESGKLGISVRNFGPAFVGIVFFNFVLFSMMNGNVAHFFSVWAIGIASIYVSLLVLLLFHRCVKAFSLVLLLPLALANGLINPVDRGLEVVTTSALFGVLHSGNPSLRPGKWLIFAPFADQPGVAAATGIEVINTLKVIPNRTLLAPFDPGNRYADIINRSGYLFADPLDKEEPASFALAGAANVIWKVNPFDPELKSIGIEHIAFAQEPPSPQLAQQLAPYLEQTLPGLTVYRRP